MKKDEVEKDGSPLDEGKTKAIMEGDSVKVSHTIHSDGRLLLWSALETPEKLRTSGLSDKL
jgi:hypothetical protein